MLKLVLLLGVVVAIVVRYVAGVEIGELPEEQHGISGTFKVLDSRTIHVEDFNYDGGGPGAWFYYYSPGDGVDRNGGGYKIPLPSEFGQSDGSLKRSHYVDVDVTVTLPEGIDACDIGTFTIWCEPFRAIFTRIEIPRSIFENDGEGECALLTETEVTPAPPEFDNCVVFNDELQLSWRVHSDQSFARFRLCGCQSTVSSTNQYMGFGLSGSTSATQMQGADPTIAWVDPVEGAQAVDYYLSAYTQCRDGEGACPDVEDSSGSCTNDVLDVKGSVEDGIQCVSFSRNFSTSDTTCDRDIDPDNEDQYIVWAVGGLGDTAFRHFIRASAGDAPIHLGRTPNDQCENVDLVCQSCSPFVNKQIIARESTTFDVVIGPSGDERGYMGITGRAGWGIALYINGTLIPELIVERGQTYTFLIHGGDNPDDLSNYHPLYITDLISGGRLENTDQQRTNEIVYAGFDESGDATAVGELCQLQETLSSQNTRESCSSLEEYISTFLVPDSCTTGQPGKLVWTPDETTPDLVYYQCATHLNLGWEIHVLDGERQQPSIDAFDNCIPFHDELQLSWKVNYNQSNIRFRLCGCHSAAPDFNQYMGFGLSGSSIGIQMQGADPTLTWVDRIEGPQAVDYHLSAYATCLSGQGACPDVEDSSGRCTNDVFDVEGSVEDGIQCVSFTRNFSSPDSVCDSEFDPNDEQFIVWAVGRVKETPLYHSMRITDNTSPVHFGREPLNQCDGVDVVCQSCPPFTNEQLVARESATFNVTIGPSGGERGYTVITGLEGTDIAFYINGTLVPELIVERGRSYTFLVYSGDSQTVASELYHPLYITDSTTGGRLQSNETIFASLSDHNTAGQHCQLLETSSSVYSRESCSSLDMYISTLVTSESCETVQPGLLIWTPDENTPDLLYYQSTTQQNIGWRIKVEGTSSAGSVLSSSLLLIVVSCSVVVTSLHAFIH